MDLESIEKEYCKKLEKAKLEENYNKIQILFYELNFLRKFYKKKNKKGQKISGNKK